jgi:hypothetical protein
MAMASAEKRKEHKHANRTLEYTRLVKATHEADIASKRARPKEICNDQHPKDANLEDTSKKKHINNIGCAYRGHSMDLFWYPFPANADVIKLNITCSHCGDNYGVSHCKVLPVMDKGSDFNYLNLVVYHIMSNRRRKAKQAQGARTLLAAVNPRGERGLPGGHRVRDLHRGGELCPGDYPGATRTATPSAVAPPPTRYNINGGSTSDGGSCDTKFFFGDALPINFFTTSAEAPFPLTLAGGSISNGG